MSKQFEVTVGEHRVSFEISTPVVPRSDAMANRPSPDFAFFTLPESALEPGTMLSNWRLGAAVLASWVYCMIPPRASFSAASSPSLSLSENLVPKPTIVTESAPSGRPDESVN